MLSFRPVTYLVLSLCLATCGGDGDSDDGPPAGPYDEIPLNRDIRSDGLIGAVHVARDEFGVAHIHADNVNDLYFATGYVMAHDRLPQMDILRRFGSGTVAMDDGSRDDVNTWLAGLDAPRVQRLRNAVERLDA